jgi:hypothetical protein
MLPFSIISSPFTSVMYLKSNNIRTLQLTISFVWRQVLYSGRKINESLGNVTVRGGKRWKGQGGARWPTVCLSVYSITENIYYAQLSSVAILPQPEPVFTSFSTSKGLGSLSCAIALQSSPPSHVFTCNGQRSPRLFCVHYISPPHRPLGFGSVECCTLATTNGIRTSRYGNSLCCS